MLRILHCPLSWPDLIYISLLIIFCIIEYVTNKWTLNLLDTQVFVHNISKCFPKFSNWIIWTNNFTLNNISQVPSMHCSLKTFYVIIKILSLFYWLNLCCCCCHSHLAFMWIRVHIFTDLKCDDPHHVWESCAEVLCICISLQFVLDIFLLASIFAFRFQRQILPILRRRIWKWTNPK